MKKETILKKNALINLIQQAIIDRENERKKIAEEKVKNMQSGYSVTYLPCGHIHGIKFGEKELLLKAKLHYDEFLMETFVLDSSECQECREFSKYSHRLI
jgi:hypothetical protein